MKWALRIAAVGAATFGVGAALGGAHPLWTLLAGIGAGGLWAASMGAAGGRT